VPKFWRFANDQNFNSARSAFYRFVKNICQSSKALFKSHRGLLKTEFLERAFQERNSGCFSYLWDGLLVLTKNYPEVWNAENGKKSAIVKLFGFLKNGTFGSPQESYPCILPLIGLLPEPIVDSEFCKSFFDSFWDGANHIDRFASVLFCKSYYECCLFLSKTYVRYLIVDILI
jgi:E3 ubiquitin-protein ligase listerin